MSERTAGWYPDPWADGQHRYWSGTYWTADVFPEGVASPSTPQGSWSSTIESEPSGPRTRDIPGPVPTTPSAAPPQPPQWALRGVPAPEAPEMPPWTPPPSPPARSRPRGVVFLVLMLLAGLLIGFLGVFGVRQLLDRRSAGTSNSAAATPFAPQVTPSGAPSTPSADPAAAALADLVVQQSDVGSTVTVAELRNGAAVAGQTTLDLCNGTFPSESLRTARLQVVAYDDQGTAQLSTEAVAYRSAAAVQQAFRELSAVAAHCPASPVTSPVGEPSVATKFLAAPDGSWPRTAGVDRQAYHFTSTDATGASSPSIAVYLKRGRILLALYFPQPDGKQSPVAGRSTVSGIVTVFQNRLAKLPTSVTGS